MAARLVSEFLDLGHVELVAQFAVPLPAVAIAPVLGLPAKARGLPLLPHCPDSAPP